MTKGFVFWFLILLYFLLNLVGSWPPPGPANIRTWYPFGSSLLLVLALVLLGWVVFGSALK